MISSTASKLVSRQRPAETMLAQDHYVTCMAVRMAGSTSTAPSPRAASPLATGAPSPRLHHPRLPSPPQITLVLPQRVPAHTLDARAASNMDDRRKCKNVRHTAPRKVWRVASRRGVSASVGAVSASDGIVSASEGALSRSPHPKVLCLRHDIREASVIAVVSTRRRCLVSR